MKPIKSLINQALVNEIRDACARGVRAIAATKLGGATIQNNIADASEFNVVLPGKTGGVFKVRITRYRGS